ncbi:MAG: hypothetical protein CMM60_01045 [Rhodospirillaceae bacterium]|jgi:hypothetical protein|nr:hypothetical protein [Rhodospirillaceae bacterium]|tara:strand:+ start:4951 stop:5160 length:210 start_codon:yes stop_codon:yes gene_type:complete
MTREEMPVTAADAAVGGIPGYQLGGGVIMNSLFATAGTVAGEKEVQSGNGMACLKANGEWQVVSDDFSS